MLIVMAESNFIAVCPSYSGDINSDTATIKFHAIEIPRPFTLTKRVP